MRIIIQTAVLMMLSVSLSASAGVYEEILSAAQRDETATVIDYLRRGMDVNTTDPQGNTLLMIAARSNNKDLVKFLVDNRANALKRNRYGDTALMISSLMGHEEVVRLILEKKVDPNQSGWSPLHYAAFENRDSIIAMLLAAGANINARAPNGWTAVMLAAQRGHVEAVRVLVGSGADLMIRDADKGDAIDLAKEGNHDDLVRFLRSAQGMGGR